MHDAPSILIQGGRLIDPAQGIDRVSDVALADGRVVAIGERLDPLPASVVIDARGLLVTPGLIDPHVHLREPGHEHKETIGTGTTAAVAGGFTTVCCMPNTLPALDSPEALDLVRASAQASGRCRVFPVAAGTVGRRGETPTDVAALVRAGAVAISDDGDAIALDAVMEAVLRRCKDAGVAFMQHCQEPALTRGAQMHQGSVSVRLGLVGWPREAEERIVQRDIALSLATGAAYHVQHISSAGSVALVRHARIADRASHITAEASPHHLLLTHDIVDTGPNGDRPRHAGVGGPWPLAKVNPPIREAVDRAAILLGVADGTITVLATDHAPHAPHEKDGPFDEAPMGMIGLEMALGLYATALIAPGVIDWPRLIAMMTIEPVRLCRLDRPDRLGSHAGSIAVGANADVTLIDPDQRWTPRRSDLAAMSHNSPFLDGKAGIAGSARAVATIVGGAVVFARPELHQRTRRQHTGPGPQRLAPQPRST